MDHLINQIIKILSDMLHILTKVKIVIISIIEF
jgi:hypothetical protein